MYLPILPISLGSPSLIAVSYSGNLNPLPLKPRASPFSSISLSLPPSFLVYISFYPQLWNGRPMAPLRKTCTTSGHLPGSLRPPRVPRTSSFFWTPQAHSLPNTETSLEPLYTWSWTHSGRMILSTSSRSLMSRWSWCLATSRFLLKVRYK